MAWYLLKNDGLFLGGSSALNVIGAYLMAKKLKKENKLINNEKKHTIVTILCDGGTRYSLNYIIFLG